MRCRHSAVSPVWVAGETSFGYQPGICGICGALVDIRNGQPMTAGQLELWVIEQIDRRLNAVRNIIFVSEVQA